MPDLDVALRPRTFDDYVGQTALKERLGVHIAATRRSILERRARPFPHMLFAAPPGVGKTTLAYVIAEQVWQPVLAFNRPPSEKELFEKIDAFGAGIVFLDEAHRLTKSAQESLLPLLEDGYLEGPGGRRSTFRQLTVLAATTERDQLVQPLIERFTTPTFAPYTDDELAEIVQFMGCRAGVWIEDDDAMTLGWASGGVPRHARQLVLAWRDLAETLDREPSALDVVALCSYELDGLTAEHMQYLDRLRRVGGTAGVETIATLMRLHSSEVRNLERLLLDRALIGLSSAGRVLTPAGAERVESRV